MKVALFVVGYGLRIPLVQTLVLTYQARCAEPRHLVRFENPGKASQARS